MGIFTKLQDAQMSVDSNYERPGHYWLLIDKCKSGKSRKGDEFCAIEKTCLHVFDDNDGTGHKPGESVTHMIMLKHDSALGNIKQFISGTMGVEPDEVDEDIAQSIFEAEGDKDHDQPLSGTVVECINRNIVTKAGKDFTVISYKREVPAQELLDTLEKKIVDRYFPNDVLVGIAEAEASE